MTIPSTPKFAYNPGCLENCWTPEAEGRVSVPGPSLFKQLILKCPPPVPMEQHTKLLDPHFLCTTKPQTLAQPFSKMNQDLLDMSQAHNSHGLLGKEVVGRGSHKTFLKV